MDYLDTVLGAAIAGLAYLVGRRSKKPYRPKKIVAICGCGHHRSFHADDGPCNKVRRDSTTGFNDRLCGCQNYRGPKPYSEVMDEELS